MLKSLVRSALLKVKTRVYAMKLGGLPPAYKQDIPYFAQWESRNLNAKILGGGIKAEDDPKWRGSGALSKAEYTAWSWSGCGIACLKMLLTHRNNRTIPLVTLGKKSLEYDCYDLPLEDSIGLKYAPFVRFVKREFGIPAKVMLALPPQQIIYELARDNYVMVSVSPLIRNPSSHPKTKSGHVVLVVGYDLPQRLFYLHNPSGDSLESQEYAEVSFTDFTKFFSGRGVVITGKDSHVN